MNICELITPSTLCDGTYSRRNSDTASEVELVRFIDYKASGT